MVFFLKAPIIKKRKMDNSIDISQLRQFLDSTQDDWNYITPKALNEALKRGTPLFLLDIRKPQDFANGHIPSSINIFWLDLLKEENLAKLPRDQKIIIICYVGHTASQALVLLSLLGYHSAVLKFGMGVPPDPDCPVAGWLQFNFITET